MNAILNEPMLLNGQEKCLMQNNKNIIITANFSYKNNH